MNKDIFLLNSLGGKKEKFNPIDKKKSVCMYVDPLFMMTPILEMLDHL
jgi:hypothetical protein